LVNKLVIENLKHRPIRTLLTVTAIALQVTMILSLVGLSKGTIEDSAKRTRGLGADIMVRPATTGALGLSNAPIPEKMLQLVQQQPHIRLVLGTVEYGTLLERMNGVDFDALNRMSGGLKFMEGHLPQGPEEIVVDEFYARQKKLHAGMMVDLIGSKWKVAGICESGKGARIFMPIRTLQDKTASPGKVSVIYATADKPENIQMVVTELKKLLPDNQIFTIEEFLSQVAATGNALIENFTNVVIGLSVAFGFLVVFLSMYMAVLERTREIGILKALGASPPYIVGMLVRETAFLALIGSVLGILLTYGSRMVVSGFPGSLTQKIVPEWWPIATGIAMVGAMLGALYPGIKAAKQDAIEALSYD